MGRRKKRGMAQPRLEGGRVPLACGVPPGVNDGFRSIAAAEGRSVSWVVDEVLCAFFGRDVLGHPKPGKPALYIVDGRRIERDVVRRVVSGRKAAGK